MISLLFPFLLLFSFQPAVFPHLIEGLNYAGTIMGGACLCACLWENYIAYGVGCSIRLAKFPDGKPVVERFLGDVIRDIEGFGSFLVAATDRGIVILKGSNLRVIARENIGRVRKLKSGKDGVFAATSKEIFRVTFSPLKVEKVFGPVEGIYDFDVDSSSLYVVMAGKGGCCRIRDGVVESLWLPGTPSTILVTDSLIVVGDPFRGLATFSSDGWKKVQEYSFPGEGVKNLVLAASGESKVVVSVGSQCLNLFSLKDGKLVRTYQVPVKCKILKVKARGEHIVAAAGDRCILFRITGKGVETYREIAVPGQVRRVKISGGFLISVSGMDRVSLFLPKREGTEILGTVSTGGMVADAAAVDGKILAVADERKGLVFAKLDGGEAKILSACKPIGGTILKVCDFVGGVCAVSREAAALVSPNGELLKRQELPGPSYPLKVLRANDKVVVVNPDGAIITDFSHPPKVVPAGGVVDACVGGNSLYLLAEGGNRALEVCLSASTPQAKVILEFEEPARSLAVSGRWLYVAFKNSLKVIDLKGPWGASFVDSFNFPFDAVSIACFAGAVWIGFENAGVGEMVFLPDKLGKPVPYLRAKRFGTVTSTTEVKVEWEALCDEGELVSEVWALSENGWKCRIAKVAGAGKRSISWDLRNTPEGTYEVEVVARADSIRVFDVVGRVVVPNRVPLVRVFCPSTVSQGTPLRVSVAVHDDDADPLCVRVNVMGKVSKSLNLVVESSLRDRTLTFNLGTLPPGEYSIKIEVDDGHHKVTRSVRATVE